MARDPAFLFYPGDYLRDTQCLSPNSQAAYDRIMCEHMRNICISQQQLNFFTKRLTEDEKHEIISLLKSIDGGFQIDWVAESIEKRRDYSESRRKNRTKKAITHDKDMKTYDEHMENENENENEIDENEEDEEDINDNLVEGGDQLKKSFFYKFIDKKQKEIEMGEFDQPANNLISKMDDYSTKLKERNKVEKKKSMFQFGSRQLFNDKKGRKNLSITNENKLIILKSFFFYIQNFIIKRSTELGTTKTEKAKEIINKNNEMIMNGNEITVKKNKNITFGNYEKTVEMKNEIISFKNLATFLLRTFGITKFDITIFLQENFWVQKYFIYQQNISLSYGYIKHNFNNILPYLKYLLSNFDEYFLSNFVLVEKLIIKKNLKSTIKEFRKYYRKSINTDNSNNTTKKSTNDKIFEGLMPSGRKITNFLINSDRQKYFNLSQFNVNNIYFLFLFLTYFFLF